MSSTVWLHPSWRLLPEIYGWWLHLPLWQSSNDVISVKHVVCLMLLFLFSCICFSVVDKLLLAKLIGLRLLLSGPSSLGQLVPSLVCSGPAPNPTPDASVSNWGVFISSENFMQASSFIIDFALSYSAWWLPSHVHSVFANVSHLSESHTSVMLGENLLR